MELQFEPIHLDEQPAYLRHLSKCPQISSDYSFINIWGWAEEYGLRWAFKDRMVWIKQTKPEQIYWAPVGSWDEVDWQVCLDTIFNTSTLFTRVPEKLVQRWETGLKNRLTIHEERGSWDYLYAVPELVELKGNRFHKKKNLLNQFVKTYDYQYLAMEPEQVESALAMQTDWCTWRDCESSETLNAENRVITRILNQWSHLTGLMGGGLFVDEVMVAYTVAERLTDDTLLIHFEKGATDYKGVYQSINQMFLANLKHEFKFVNREQDLDDEGLRKAKLSYNPVDYLRKYRVRIS